MEPLKNYLKLNVDEALCFDQKRVGIGMVLRDLATSLCFAASIVIPDIQDPKVIELMAILRGL